jgi:hypothetical protein
MIAYIVIGVLGAALGFYAEWRAKSAHSWNAIGAIGLVVMAAGQLFYWYGAGVSVLPVPRADSCSWSRRSST